MRNLRNENGAITMLVVVSVVFIVVFLMSSYILISNKVKTQKEMISETRKTYETDLTMEEIYNSYFNNSNIIPIYTVDQLLAMGDGSSNVNINGKYYNFTNDENTIYMLMNNIEFKASDYTDKLDNGYWMPVGDRIDAYEQTLSTDISEQTETEEDNASDTYFKAKFEGKNNNITVTYVDDENDEYSVIYSETSKYCEPEYEIKVIPTFSDGTVANEAKILKNNEETGSIGETIVTIKRLKQTTISSYLNDSYTTPSQTVSIVNPDKIEDLNLKLESINVDLTIETTPSNATISIEGQTTNTVTVPKGTTVNYTVSCDNYYTKTGSVKVNQTMTLPLELAPLNYVSFSESFYFTRCSDETFNGLLNGGTTTFKKYDLGGGDYSMGSFYIDESDIVQKIPSTGIISKVTLYFEYYQTRNNTILYTNTIKTSIYTGTTGKMAQEETERSNKTTKQAQYELHNISRKDLEDGIVVNLTNYIEGTLSISSSVKNMYCVIEGEKPDV